MLIERHHKLPSFDSNFLGRIVWLQLLFWFIFNPLLISFAVGCFLVIVFICVGINLSLVFIIIICSKDFDGSLFFIYLPVDVELLNFISMGAIIMHVFELIWDWAYSLARWKSVNKKIQKIIFSEDQQRVLVKWSLAKNMFHIVFKRQLQLFNRMKRGTFHFLLVDVDCFLFKTTHALKFVLISISCTCIISIVL